MLLDLFEWLAGYYGGFRVFGYLTLRGYADVINKVLEAKK